MEELNGVDVKARKLMSVATNFTPTCDVDHGLKFVPVASRVRNWYKWYYDINEMDSY